MVFRRKWVVGTALVASIALLVVLMKTTKTGLVPDEDMGCIFMNVTTPPGSSLSQTIKAMSEVEKCIKDIPQIARYSNVSGYSMMGGQAPSGGMLIIKLKPWEERTENKDNINAVINEIYRRTVNIKSAKLFVFAQPTIMGYGMGSGFELYVQDRAGGDINTLQKYTTNFIAALNQRPEIQMAYTSFDTKFPQYTVEVDAAKCQRAGVTTTDVLNALSGFIGGNYSSNFNRFSKLYRVMVQADKTYRLDKNALNNMFIRTSSGEMAPIGQFVNLTKVYGTETLTRFNLYSSIQVNGLPADGYSTGEAIAAIAEVAKETLPVGYGYEFGGITREEAGSGSNTVIISPSVSFRLPHPLRPVREHLCTAGRHVECTVWTDGKFPLRQNVGTGKQHLHADRSHHANRPAGQNSHPSDRVCLSSPPPGHDHRTSSRIGSRRPSASHPDDSPYDDHRSVSTGCCLGCRSQR